MFLRASSFGALHSPAHDSRPRMEYAKAGRHKTSRRPRKRGLADERDHSDELPRPDRRVHDLGLFRQQPAPAQSALAVL